jgi:acyl-CoA thioesterase-1
MDMNKAMIQISGWICLSLMLTACASRRPPTLNPSSFKGAIRVACIGDSITYGSGIENRETNSYPAVLEQRLGPKFQVRNFGVSGATLLKKGDKPYANLPEFAAASDFVPQVVIIQLGSNDTKPENWRFGNEFAADLRALVEHFQRLPSKPQVWLCLPVPVYETRWGINEATLSDEVIPAILKVAQDKRLPIIDLHAGLSNRPELFPDKVHPNAAGAALMAKTIRDALLAR